MTPLALYNQKVLNAAIEDNPAQRKVIEYLELLYTQIMHDTSVMRFKRLVKLQAPIKGLYLWGGVGCGKTFLVDLLYSSLPVEVVLRMHFNIFMQTVHNLLTTFQGQINPLKLVAAEFIKHKVLIFDEFYVSDITDAMLLGTLLQELFKMEIILVATSNLQPDLLYLNGLQRNKFLPAISAIEKYCTVMCLDSGIDYRTQTLTNIDVFYYPNSDQTEKILRNIFHKISPSFKFYENDSIKINDRTIKTKIHNDNIVWFDFAEICETARSADDYIQLAKLYNTIIISNVPVFDEHNQDSARRFIELIDELYDHKIKLIMSLQTDVQHLAININNLPLERTISRLQEMGTKEYMQLPRIK